MTANHDKLEVVNRFFSGTGFSYDQVVALCTCGLDKHWKKEIIKSIPARPARIIDQACGTGILTFEIARRFPDCRVIGVELRDEYLGIARQKAHRSGIENVDFILGRAEDVVLHGDCDCITSSYLAKYADLEKLIANAKKMLRPGGLLVMHDFTYPDNPIFLSLWRAYFHILRRVGARIFPEWRAVFSELPEFLHTTRWVSESLALMKETAYGDISSESLTFGASAVVMARKP